MENANNKEYLDKIRTSVIENLRRTTFAPSVQMTDVPRDSMAMNDEDDAILDDLDEDENPDKRHTKRRFDQMIEKDGELSDSEDEEMKEANGVRRQPGAPKRKNQINYRNLTEFVGADSGVDSGAGTPQVGSSLPDNDVDEEMNLGDAAPTNGESQTGQLATTNGSAAVSSAHSPVPAADTNGDGDVQMEDSTTAPVASPPSAPVLQEKTPPDSPAVAAAPTPAPVPETEPTEESIQPEAATEIKEEGAAEEAAIVAQNEGEAEKETENVNAEAAAEEAMKAEGSK